MDTERKDIEPKVIQSAEDMDTKHNERPQRATAIKAIDKRELCKQIQHQENSTLVRSGWISKNQTGYTISRTLCH